MGLSTPIRLTTGKASRAKMIVVAIVPVFSARPGSLRPPVRTKSMPMSEEMMPAALSRRGYST